MYFFLSDTRLEPVKVYEESKIFRHVMAKLKFEDCKDFQNLDLTLKICDKIHSKLQENDLNVSLELDFLSRSVNVESIEFLIQVVIANPDLYEKVLQVLQKIVKVQPTETFTQASLNQGSIHKPLKWSKIGLKIVKI